MTDSLLDDPLLAPFQLVAPDGTRTPTSGAAAADDLGERMAGFYETMVAVRELDEELVNLQRQGQLALFPSCRGQEAAQVGCVAALRDSDWLFPQYRELGAFLVRGIDPGGIGLAWRGTWHGGLGFVERAVAPMSIPIGTHALHAVGAAMASTWLGDGAMSEGDVHEAMNLAGVHRAPCIFYVQSNGWAISTPIADQCRAPSLAHKAVGYGGFARHRAPPDEEHDEPGGDHDERAVQERRRPWRHQAPARHPVLAHRAAPETAGPERSIATTERPR